MRPRPLAAARDRLDSWFTAPEPRAAGRAGLFRIVYALLYLWQLSLFDLSATAGAPSESRLPLLLLAALPGEPPAALLAGLDLALVAALVLLAFGWRTRAVTVAVLIAGVLREAWLSGIAVENGNVFLVFYIPLFMAVAGGWEGTYSLDAAARRQRGEPVPDPSDPDGRYFLAARATLVILVALFVTSPLFKSFSGGTWLEQPDLLAKLMLYKSVVASSMGLPANPVAPFIAAHPFVHVPMQRAVLLFEGLFFLSLFGTGLRNLFFAMALVFHSANALFMLVSFTPILAAYAMFLDWEGLRLRVAPQRPEWLPSPSPGMAALCAVATALLVAGSWRSGTQAIFNLGGLLDWRTPFFVIGPLAAVWAVREASGLVRAGLRRTRS